MKTNHILLAAALCVLPLGVNAGTPAPAKSAGPTQSKATAPAPKKRAAAPADEYFGKQHMSAIGVRMRIDSLGRAYHARSKADGDLLHDAQIAEESLRAWMNRYPKDAWLAPTAFHLEQLYAVIQTNEARVHATAMLHFITDNFANTQAGHLSRLRLAQGFPALQEESPVVLASATPDATSSAAPQPSLTPSAAPSSAPSTAPSTLPAPSAPASAKP